MSERAIKVYCAGAIRGKLFNKEYFEKIIRIAKELGAHPKTEKSGGHKVYQVYPLENFSGADIQNVRDKLVAERDREWIRESTVVIAEFSGASTGTGWEVCYATRVERKPTLCLFHKKSVPSLMIKQDNSEYTIVQMYKNESEFENYVRCFLEIAKRSDKIAELKENYFIAREKIDSNTKPEDIKNLVESLVMPPSFDLPPQSRLKPDIETLYILRPSQVDIDFKDAENFVSFLFRNLVLEKRWENLKSQEIGTTFTSGRKPFIIKALSHIEQVPTSLLEIYNRQGTDRIKYTREAFTKNIRAFRRIGLLETPEKVEPIQATSMHFKDKLMLVKDYSNIPMMVSSRSPQEVKKSLIIVTQHLQHLSRFLETFGANSLVDFLNQSRHNGLLSSMPHISVHNIDAVNTRDFLNERWAQNLVPVLHSECRKIWSEQYSTYKSS